MFSFGFIFVSAPLLEKPDIPVVKSSIPPTVETGEDNKKRKKKRGPSSALMQEMGPAKLSNPWVRGL